MFKGWITLYVMETLSSGCAYKTYCAIHCIDINTEQGILSLSIGKSQASLVSLHVMMINWLFRLNQNIWLKRIWGPRMESSDRASPWREHAKKKIKQTFDKASWGNKNNVSSLRNLLWCCGMLSMTPRRDNILAKHFPLGRQSLTENEFFTQRWGKTSYACDQRDLHGAWIDLKSRINPAKYKKQKNRLSYQLLSTYPDKCNTRRTCTSGRTRGPLASLRSDIPL